MCSSPNPPPPVDLEATSAMSIAIPCLGRKGIRQDRTVTHAVDGGFWYKAYDILLKGDPTFYYLGRIKVIVTVIFINAYLITCV
ncbi:hypothetical protein AAMO2058_000702500 [Amorphochlora amoebiformis]